MNEFKLTADIKIKLESFVKWVLEYNKKINLTAITDPVDFWVRQVEDTINLFNYYDFTKKQILDVGTGSGVPGIIIAICNPKAKVTLVESSTKKTDFCQSVVSKMSLNNVTVVNDRVENYKKKFQNKFDFTLAKAVANLKILVELCSFTIKKGGRLIFFKGKNYNLELPNNMKIKSYLGIQLTNSHKYILSNDIERYLIEFKKVQKTHRLYPRNYSQIKNKSIF